MVAVAQDQAPTSSLASNMETLQVAGNPSASTSSSHKFDGSNSRPTYEKLLATEKEWCTRLQYFERNGFRLRSRYQPNWTASWLEGGKNAGKDPRECDDGPPKTALFGLMDATMAPDDRLVNLKYVSSYFHEHEVAVVEYLNGRDLRQDPDNHTVPLLRDTLQSTEKASFLVMPLLRGYDDPRMDTIGELVECLDQTFKGMKYMHDHDVAYRCPTMELMVDPEPLYPEMFHPIATERSRDLRGHAHRTTRTRQPTRYYFADFGNSIRFKTEAERTAGPVLGVKSEMQAPEFRQSDVPCDPFLTDIYYLGNMLHRQVLQRYNGFGFLDSLVDEMRDPNPYHRPSMDSVVNRFQGIRDALSRSKLRSRLVRKDEPEGFMTRIRRGVRHAFRTMNYQLQGLEPIPTPSYTVPIRNSA